MKPAQEAVALELKRLRQRVAELERAETERQRTLDEVARLTAIIESCEDAIIGRTLDGLIESWNPGAERLFGYRAEEILGQPISVLLAPGRLGEEAEVQTRIRRGECVEHRETIRVRKDGRPVRVSVCTLPVRNRAGDIVGATQVMRDVSERSEYERSQAQLAAVVESSEDAIIGKTLGGIIETWNHGAEQLYGYRAEEVIGRSIMLLLPPERHEEENEMLARLRRGERVDHVETTRVRKDGTPVNVSLSISPVRNRAGEIVGASHVARNITERARYESATAQLAAIVESSEDAIISKNLDGIILTWNAGAERVYGYTAEEARYRPMTMLLPADRPDEETGILDRLKRGERVQHFETVRVRKDGKRIDVSLTISPVRDAQGRVRGASHIARDITERKMFEAQLQETQKLESLGVLAGGIAHDFNNLLTGILGNASLALDESPQGSAGRGLLEDVIKAAERAASLTRQLLAYAGKGRFITEALNLSELVREISGLLQASIPRKVQFLLDLQPDLPPIEADAAQMQQVVMNLAINGAEAIGEHTGVVTITTSVRDVDEQDARVTWQREDLPPGRYVSLEVQDTGSGMDEATISRIFDPFFTTKFAGRGLGLAAVLGIVRSHRGALRVYSTPGRGSTFKLLFPVAAGARYPGRLLSHADLHGQGTVLVVDDEATVRDTARNTLEHYGYRVLLAKDGAEGLTVYRENADEIEIVLLDLTMPAMGGEEVLEHMQAIRPGVRVLLSSGFNEVEAVRQFIGKGLAGFIQKPYTAIKLAERVKALLAKAE